MAMRRRFIAGNWKMFNGPEATCDFMKKFPAVLKADKDVMAAIRSGKIETAIFPPFVSLAPAISAKGDAPVIVGAQNCHWEQSGAFTGEISVPMLKEICCTHVIIGHSERRHIFHETDEELNKKMKAVLAGLLTPVFCVGEMLEDREAGKAHDVIKTQMVNGLTGLDAQTFGERVIVAYEPVWAIGTGKTASAKDAQEICSFIRKTVAELFGENAAEKVLILYGGSVKPANAAQILAESDIDGVLVGGASLKPDSFYEIVKAAL